MFFSCQVFCSGSIGNTRTLQAGGKNEHNAEYQRKKRVRIGRLIS